MKLIVVLYICVFFCNRYTMNANISEKHNLTVSTLNSIFFDALKKPIFKIED